MRDQRAAQRDREQHAEHAAARRRRGSDVQNGKPVHQPMMTSPGSTKMIADSVPAADATVCTMLFSRIDELRDHAQERHRDHRGRDRRREGEAHLEAEIHVGRREDGRDERAEDQARGGSVRGLGALSAWRILCRFQLRRAERARFRVQVPGSGSGFAVRGSGSGFRFRVPVRGSGFCSGFCARITLAGKLNPERNRNQNPEPEPGTRTQNRNPEPGTPNRNPEPAPRTPNPEPEPGTPRGRPGGQPGRHLPRHSKGRYLSGGECVQCRAEERQHRDAGALARRGPAAARLRDRQADRVALGRPAHVRAADALSHAPAAREPRLDQGTMGGEGRASASAASIA